MFAQNSADDVAKSASESYSGPAPHPPPSCAELRSWEDIPKSHLLQREASGRRFLDRLHLHLPKMKLLGKRCVIGAHLLLELYFTFKICSRPHTFAKAVHLRADNAWKWIVAKSVIHSTRRCCGAFHRCYHYLLLSCLSRSQLILRTYRGTHQSRKKQLK